MSILETLFGIATQSLVDLENLPSFFYDDAEEEIPDVAAGVSGQGLNCDVIPEPTPKFSKASCERVITSGTNAWIVLGRDRPSNKASGYGGQGGTAAGSIDLVVGRKPLDPELEVDPSFISDAARIHISQRTDVDRNLGLVSGQVGAVEARSAIGMKADEIRLVARGGIKIVTEGRGAINSAGGKIKSTSGIDLIAGNDEGGMGFTLSPFPPFFSLVNDPLQPIPKGLELRDALLEMMDTIDDLAAMVGAMANQMVITNNALSAHIHPVFIGPVTSPPVVFPMVAQASNTLLFTKCIAPMYLHRTNTQTFRFNFLTEVGEKWICSRFNNTT
jgi:hypothetical protein